MPYDDLGSIFKIFVLGSPAEKPILYVRRGTQKSVHRKSSSDLPAYCSRIIHLPLCSGYLHRPEFSIFVFHCPLTWLLRCQFSTNRTISHFSRLSFNATYSRKFSGVCLSAEINVLFLCSFPAFCCNSLETNLSLPLEWELQTAKGQLFWIMFFLIISSIYLCKIWEIQITGGEKRKKKIHHAPNQK